MWHCISMLSIYAETSTSTDIQSTVSQQHQTEQITLIKWLQNMLS